MNQKDLARCAGITQGAVSHRIRRIKDRLVFVVEWKKFDINEKDLDIFDTINKTILILMAKTTCQSETARMMNSFLNLPKDKKMNQVKVRHRFYKCLARLEKLSKKDPIYKKYFDYFKFIGKNLWVLHEVKLPQFDYAL
jgi:hypothetical protein